MTIKDNPDLEDALDGLQHAGMYCFENGMLDLGHEIADKYQELAQNSPREEWDSYND